MERKPRPIQFNNNLERKDDERREAEVKLEQAKLIDKEN